VVAAFNEEAVIGRHLDLLLRGTGAGELDVVVAANGCVDATVEVAQTRGVRVLDLPAAGKAGALNAGDAAATAFPRIYLDADVGVDADGVRALVAALEAPPADGPAALVAVPDRELVTTGRPWPVRSYYAVQSRLPAAQTGLFGRGMIAVSERGRARFDAFPEAVADDLFLDGVFGLDERVVVASVRTRVETPRTTRDLVRRLTRVRRGNAELRAAAERGEVPRVRPASRTSWLRDVVVRQPRLAPAGVVFAVLTLVAELRARRPARGWEVDASTRTPQVSR
jgi:glycosyltransferase involved in cell wall biosynthesis